MKDFAVANDVPLWKYDEAALSEPRCLDIEFFLNVEVVGEFPQELVSHDSKLESWRPFSRSSYTSKSNPRYIFMIDCTIHRPNGRCYNGI